MPACLAVIFAVVCHGIEQIGLAIVQIAKTYGRLGISRTKTRVIVFKHLGCHHSTIAHKVNRQTVHAPAIYHFLQW